MSYKINPNSERYLNLHHALSYLQAHIHNANVVAGWWNDNLLGDILRYIIPTKLALVHSEVSEALEGFRKDLNDNHLPHRSMIEVELADTMIRIFDIAGALNLDLAGAILEKHNYNLTRSDHKPENREAPGGKKI